MASLSFDDLGGSKYKIRWREIVPGEDGKPERGEDGRIKRRDRSYTVEGKESLRTVMAAIQKALDERGEWYPPTAAPAPEETNLEQASLAWLRWKSQRCEERSRRKYALDLKRFFETVRELKQIPATAIIPASVLSRNLFVDVQAAWKAAGLSESTIYNAATVALDCWAWITDDPDEYPNVPAAPRVKANVLPRPPVYVAPPAPTLAELDACLRNLELDRYRRLGCSAHEN